MFLNVLFTSIFSLTCVCACVRVRAFVCSCYQLRHSEQVLPVDTLRHTMDEVEISTMSASLNFYTCRRSRQ